MKKYLIAVLILFSLTFYLNVQAQTEETITLTTYYPSPFGVYNVLRLFPSAPKPATDCDSNLEVGNMYYNSSTNQVMVCRQTVVFPPTYAWEAIDSLWRLLGTTLSPSNLAWNVGIGTSTTTGEGLRIRGTGTRASVILENPDAIAAAGMRLEGTPVDRLIVGTFGGVPIDFITSAAPRMRIDANGDVGIGTTALGAKLTILEPIQNRAALIAIWDNNPNNWRIGLFPRLGGGSFNPITQADDAAIIFNRFGQNTGNLVIAPWASTLGGIRITNTGRVGIGTASPGSSPGVILEIGQPNIVGAGSLKLNNSGPSNVLVFRPTIYLNHIDTAPPIDYGGTINWQENNVSQMELFYSSPDNGLVIWSGGPRVVFRRDTGNVGIGTVTPTSRLHVIGSFTATGGKFFEIDHPTKQGMKLIHASVEGPEVAVFYRGQAQLINGEAMVELPDYFEALTRKEGRTAQLTPKGTEPYLLSASEVSEAKFKVHGTKINGEFYWEVKAVRADIEPLRVEVKKEDESSG